MSDSEEIIAKPCWRMGGKIAKVFGVDSHDCEMRIPQEGESSIFPETFYLQIGCSGCLKRYLDSGCLASTQSCDTPVFHSFDRLLFPPLPLLLATH
jgi:hypothetical protein